MEVEHRVEVEHCLDLKATGLSQLFEPPKIKPWVTQSFLTFDFMDRKPIHWKGAEQYFTVVMFVILENYFYQFWTGQFLGTNLPMSS